MKKSLIALTIVLMLLLAACGGGASDSASTASPDAAAPVEQNTAPENGTDADAGQAEADADDGQAEAGAVETTAPETGGSAEADSSEADAYELYTLANSFQTEADSYAMTYTAEIDMTVDGEPYMIQAMIGDIRMNVTDMIFDMTLTSGASVGEETQEIEIYAFYVDGYYYMDLQGQKLKVSMPVEEAMGQSGVADMGFEESSIISQSVDGNTLTFILNNDVMSELYADTVNQVLESDSTAEVTYSDSVCVVELNDNGSLKGMGMTGTVDIIVDGSTMSMRMLIDMTVSEIGNVTVELPADLDAYEETELYG